jgi:aminoglycoside phosphotransferase (APT) family kinase protein
LRRRARRRRQSAPGAGRPEGSRRGVLGAARAFRGRLSLPRAAGRSGRIRQGPGREVVVGHGDWYCGNLRFENSRLVAAFDWDLLVDTEPVIVGMAAASYADSGESGGGLLSPEDIVAFMRDYEAVNGRRFDSSEQSIAAAAATWVLAYNARCQLSLLSGPPPAGSILDLLHIRRQEYVDLRW